MNPVLDYLAPGSIGAELLFSNRVVSHSNWMRVISVIEIRGKNSHRTHFIHEGGGPRVEREHRNLTVHCASDV